MNFKKLLCLVLAILMILPFAFSCKNNGNTNGSEGGSGDENKPLEKDPALLYFVFDGATDYKIVHSANLNENHRIVEACRELAATVKTRTGVEIPVVSDAEPAGEYEIIVGETSRQESLGFIRDLKNGQYTVRAMGNKIVIAGYSDSITVGAINYFADLTANGIDTETKIMSIEKTFDATFTGETGKSTVTVMGRPLGDYTIVYPSDYTASEKRLTAYFVEQVYKLTGAFVRMSSDDSSFDNEILIGKTARTVANAPEGHSFSISGKGGKLQLQASSMFAYYSLITYVTDELFAANRPTLNITESFEYSRDVKSTLTGGAEYADKKSGEYRIMSQNIWGNTGQNHVNRHMMTLELILAYDADVLAIQECDPRNRQGGDYAFDKLLAAEGYSEAVPPTGLSGNNYTPIFYKTEKFELLECAYLKYDTEYDSTYNDRGSKGYTWAVLKDKATGDTFGVLSTHFWFNSESAAPGSNNARLRNATEVVNALKLITQKYGNIAIFACGDLNSNYKSNPVKTILNAGAVWAPYASKKTENIKTNHAYPGFSSDLGMYVNPVFPEVGKGENSIDHIFIYNEKSANLNRYDVCTDLYSLLTADHCALFLDFDIK